MTGRARAATAWLAAAALIAAGWIVLQVAPGPEVYWETFYRSASIGETAATAKSRVTVLEVRAAEAVSDSTGWRSDVAGSAGNDSVWILVDLEVEGRYREPDPDPGLDEGLYDIAPFGMRDIEAGGESYRASERPQQSLGSFGNSYPFDTVTTGTLAFEVPADVLDLHDARVVLAHTGVPSMEEAIIVPLWPSELDVAAHAAVHDTITEPAS
ncbi:hypothetical protein [Microbacterium sediminis]|uniref:hypothetical protein n=1 Tax=Microbacterium sediminis TaxID=904291 RepID=UPI0010717728|nr:hypothetical protein [Microbacterium sediminis]QBR75108.1 hypothetical protein E3O41_12360 [Microbacterium sediminis]